MSSLHRRVAIGIALEHADITSLAAESYTLIILVWIALVLRLWTRMAIVKKLAWDDAWMILTAVFYTAYCAISIRVVIALNDTVQSLDIGSFTNTIIAGMIIYPLTTMTLKISLCLFFLRLLVQKTQRCIVYTVLVVSIVVCVMYALYNLLQCGTSYGLAYALKQASGHCASNNVTLAISLTHGVTMTITDFTCTGLVLSMLYTVKMPRRQKITVGAILILAIMGSLGSIVRLCYVKSKLDSNLSLSANLQKVTFWTSLEIGLGIIAGCMATLRPLFKRFLETSGLSRRSHPYSSRKIQYAGKQYELHARQSKSNEDSTARNSTVHGNSQRECPYSAELDIDEASLESQLPSCESRTGIISNPKEAKSSWYGSNGSQEKI